MPPRISMAMPTLLRSRKSRLSASICTEWLASAQQKERPSRSPKWSRSRKQAKHRPIFRLPDAISCSRRFSICSKSRRPAPAAKFNSPTRWWHWHARSRSMDSNSKAAALTVARRSDFSRQMWLTGCSVTTLHPSFVPKCAACSTASSWRCKAHAETYALDPALELTRDDVADHGHAARAIIETGDRSKVFAPRLLENSRVLHRNLLQSFETVGREAWRDDREIFNTALGQRFHGRIGIGLKPLGGAEARLERHDQTLVI